MLEPYKYQQKMIDSALESTGFLCADDFPFPIHNFAKYIREENRGFSTHCWIWTGALAGLGSYGTFSWVCKCSNGRHQRGAHVIAFFLWKGPFPTGKPIPDHLCKVHECCNPDHLEAVTHKENSKRSISGSKTQCKHGHPFDVKNTYINTRGQRECKECRRNAVRKNKGLGVVT